MIMSIFSRTELILGSAALERLGQAHVMVFGVGGVGSYASEALVRCGVGTVTLVDHDLVNETNINRQAHALHSTIGQLKIEAMASRLLDINPDAKIHKIAKFYSQGAADEFFSDPIDYVLDCIDTLACKIDLAIEVGKRGISIISCMGTGNKLDPSRFQVSDISKTRDCPMARNMRKELRRRGINHLKVVYSQEAPIAPLDTELHGAMLQELSQGASSRRAIPGSVSFVPAAAGLLMVAEAVKDMLNTT